MQLALEAMIGGENMDQIISLDYHNFSRTGAHSYYFTSDTDLGETDYDAYQIGYAVSKNKRKKQHVGRPDL